MSLSICIPAYVRPELLGTTVQSILGNGGAEANVEILILDDSEENLNEKVAKDLSRFSANIRYISNERRLGLDENIKRCYDSATKDYILVIGEDDQITNRGITRILSHAQASEPHKIDVILINYVYCSNDYLRLIGGALFPTASADSINRSWLLDNFYKLGFIGAFVISREAWKKYRHLAPSGTFFPHLGVLGNLFFGDKDPRITIVSDICVLNRAEDLKSSTWAERSLSVHYGYYAALQTFQPDLNSGDWQRLTVASRKLFRPDNPLWLVSKRADNAYNLHEYRSWHAGTKQPIKIVCYGCAVMPVSLARFAKFFYLLLRRFRTRMVANNLGHGVSNRNFRY